MRQVPTTMTEAQKSIQHFHIRKRTVPLVCGGLVLLALLIFALHPIWLTWVAEYLDVSEKPERADAIIILGGGRGQRCQYATHLYREGYAPKIIVMGDALVEGCCCSQREYMLEQLASQGLSGPMIILAPPSTSTYEEARNALAVLQQIGAHSAIVVTDPYHTRRAAATFRKAWRGSGISAHFCAANPSWFNADQWWTRERELLVVFEEYEKLIYYWLSGKI